MRKSLLHVVQKANSLSPLKVSLALNQSSMQHGMSWVIQGTRVGLLPPSTVQHLLDIDCQDTFILHQDPRSSYLELNPLLDSFDSRTLAVSKFLKKCKDDGSLPRLQKSWRRKRRCWTFWIPDLQLPSEWIY
jgi:hypothetical protein